MITNSTTFYVGSAQRLANGSVNHWTQGRTQYPTLEQCRNYIDGLIRSYKERGNPVRADEFVPIEVTTRIHLPDPEPATEGKETI